MVIQVSVAEAKNKLTQLLQLVEQGKRVTICRHGKPIVELIPASPNQRRERVFGGKRAVILDPSWAKPQDDIEAWLRGDV